MVCFIGKQLPTPTGLTGKTPFLPSSFICKAFLLGALNKVSDKSKTVTEEWVSEHVKHLVMESFNYIQKQASTHGDVAADTLLLSFIASLVGATLFKTLTSTPDTLKTREAKSKYLISAFSDIKLSLQNAVAQGFTTATTKFSGKDMDYYCEVKPTGPVINKLPC